MNDLLPHYHGLICGSTATALGFAGQSPSEHLIVERTSLAASEFIDSYNTGSRNGKVGSPTGKLLKEQLVQRNILNDGGLIHIPAAAPVLFQWIKDTGLNMLFMTEIVNIKKREDLYEVSLYNNSGLQKVTADYIVDTTSTGFQNSGLSQHIVSKSINAMLHCPEKTDFPFQNHEIINHPAISFHEGRFAGEIIMKFFLNRQDDWITARNKLHTFWRVRPDAIKTWNIASVASTFDFKLDEKGPYIIQPKWQWVPSCAYGNLLNAFEAGVVLAQSLKVGGVL